ncbi:MAG: alpha-amylase family glycosyl hydrolase [Corallococcus sp.]|nr:alpha-amylase family glycosyl hydrolase [Corallococcus sp.]MCM1359006.1 alpha-amylase family glycosyl hydrolase [Corallococcus sp.]MCM1394995.1 alpha-amylase family glycosyl hydrolase [Corallococcus sp.]
MPGWLKTAVFYEIYPQSFCDSNADGIGDIRGIISKLDYVRELGFNALWLNPCYLSPFMDAGYDVADHKSVAPRYGTNEDLCKLFCEAHKRGMRVILDLVPGHTSDQHKWFEESKKPARNEYSDRYIWSDSVWNRPADHAWVSGMSDRDGCYMLNFFNSQPALNYGFNNITQPGWQISYEDPRVQPTFEALLDVMRFWLDKGCDGFRVDMADSLVKNDEEKIATASLWQRARKMLDEKYPEAVLVSEWCNAPRAINMAGFHCDFLLNHYQKLTYYAFRCKSPDGINKSYFCKTAHVSARDMLTKYLDELRETWGKGYISVISGNHDTERISYMLDESELRLAYVFLLTLPGVPFFYYGDEIGMRYIPQTSKEGGYHRTGSRTPMQWDADKKNLGFSDAECDKLYLNVDAAPNAPCAAQQMRDEGSLWNLVKNLNSLRAKTEDLQSDGEIQVLVCDDDGVLCYKRGKNVCVAFNPTDRPQAMQMQIGKVLFETGSHKTVGNAVSLAPQTAVVFLLK